MTETRAARAAQFFYDLRRGRQQLQPLPQDLRPAGIEEAYAMQEALVDLYARNGRGAIGGYKIAITTKVMQELMGIDTPCGGTIFAPTIHRSPAKLKVADFGQVAVECEIAVRLGADLAGSGKPYTKESVGEAVEACMPAIELVDDAKATYRDFNAMDLIADNSWNAGCVLGEPVTDWRRLDLGALKGTMTVGGELMGSGVGADVLGHPFNALAWLANNQVTRGRPLRRGMVVITGSIVSTKWPKPGQEVVVEIDGLGQASANFA